MNRKPVVVVGVVAAVIAAVIVVAVGVAFMVIDVNSYREEIELRLEAELGREVTLGEMSLGLLPPRFQVQSTAIAEATGFGDRAEFVTAERLAISVDLFPLLSGDVRITSLELDRPSVELVRNAEGLWNFSTLGGGEDAAPEEPDSPASGSATTRFELRRLTIRDGLVGVTDLGRGPARTVYDHIDVTISDFSPGSPFSFEITAHLPGEGAQELALAGTLGPLQLGDPLATPVTGTLALREVGMDGLRGFLHSDRLATANGSLSGETTVENGNGRVRTAGRLVLDRARFEDLDLGFPVALEYDAVVDLPGRRVSIAPSTIELGTTPIAVTGTIDTGLDPAAIDLEARSNDVSVAELARMASAFGVAFPPDVAVEGRTSIDVRASGPLSDPRLEGTIAGRDLRISGDRVRVPVEVDAIDVVLTPAEIRADDFQVRAGETLATARFRFAEYASENPVIDARLVSRDATLDEIRSIMRAYGVGGLDRIEGAGRMNLNLQASGPLGSVRSESVARILDGNLNVDFTPLRVLGFDAAGKLSSLVGYDDGAPEQDFTEIVTLRGNVDVVDGVARTEDLVAQLTIGEVALAGTADLASETLDLRLAAVFSEAFTDQVRASGVGRGLEAAFTNTAGELVLPARVTGTFADPRLVPDAEALTRMQLERALDDPSGFLDALLGRAGAESEGGASNVDAPDAGPGGAIRGILGGLFGGGANDDQD